MSYQQDLVFFFAAVAAGGLLMAGLLAAKRPIPNLISTGHGLAGLVAVALLFVVNLKGREQTPDLSWWALGVLASGMVGGLLLFRVIFKNRATLPLAAMHGSLGLVGIYLLYRVAF